MLYLSHSRMRRLLQESRADSRICYAVESSTTVTTYLVAGCMDAREANRFPNLGEMAVKSDSEYNLNFDFPSHPSFSRVDWLCIGLKNRLLHQPGASIHVSPQNKRGSRVSSHNPMILGLKVSCPTLCNAEEPYIILRLKTIFC